MKKRLKPETDVKITYNTKKKKVKNIKLRTNILGGDLVVEKTNMALQQTTLKIY